MSVAEVPGHESSGTKGAWLQDLLRRCGVTTDQTERARLLSEVAENLEQAARQLTASGRDSHDVRERVAALYVHAGTARFMAELERGNWAAHLDPCPDRDV
jgi:hypothetical protein